MCDENGETIIPLAAVFGGNWMRIGGKGQEQVQRGIEKCNSHNSQMLRMSGKYAELPNTNCVMSQKPNYSDLLVVCGSCDWRTKTLPYLAFMANVDFPLCGLCHSAQ